MPEVFKARLDWALNNVVISGCPCPWQDAWNEMIFKISSNPNHSVILWNLSTRVDSSPKKPYGDRNFPAHELLMLTWGSQQTSTMLLQHTNRPQCWAAEGSPSRASEARQKQLCQAPRHTAGMKWWHHTANVGNAAEMMAELHFVHTKKILWSDKKHKQDTAQWQQDVLENISAPPLVATSLQVSVIAPTPVSLCLSKRRQK